VTNQDQILAKDSNKNSSVYARFFWRDTKRCADKNQLFSYPLKVKNKKKICLLKYSNLKAVCFSHFFFRVVAAQQGIRAAHTASAALSSILINFYLLLRIKKAVCF